MIFKNNKSLNISKMTTSELIKFINKNSSAVRNKSSDIKDRELFALKNQDKKLRNNIGHKKIMKPIVNSNITITNNSNNNVFNKIITSNNNENCKEMIIPFEIENTNKCENGNFNYNEIREKLSDVNIFL